MKVNPGTSATGLSETRPTGQDRDRKEKGGEIRPHKAVPNYNPAAPLQSWPNMYQKTNHFLSLNGFLGTTHRHTHSEGPTFLH